MRSDQITKQYRKIPLWILLAVSAFFFILSALSLRANNQRMIELREAVFVADQENGDIETALRELRQYVHAHMNTDLAAGENAIRPPIQLRYHYERLLEAELAKRGSNNDVYTEAQNHCERTQPTGHSGRNRLDCVQQYVDQHGDTQLTDIDIPDDLYKFDFISPKWSPDLAGISLVLGCIFIGLFIIRLLVDKAIQKKLSI